MTDASVSNNSDKNLEPTTSRTSSSLLERARASDQDAWCRIVHLYSPLIYGWCRGNGLQEADATDVGQDVFRSVALNLAKFQHDERRGSFRGWLRIITRSKIVDFWRVKQKGHAAQGGSDAYECLQQLAAAENETQDLALSEELQFLHRRALEMIQSEFSEIHWRAFLRTAVDQQRASEVAQELGTTRDVVYNARSRILHRLREEFANVIEMDLE
ncbi:MAG: RNA polymerase sigma-70 factor (ECF subfamily) [Pirellulaceae bacterium]|jgi:RNA polymerase sigma-70 factor (ECF subfamily)